MTQTPPVLITQEVVFPNGNRAHLLVSSSETSPSEIAKALHFQRPEALMLVIGGAEGLDESLKARLIRLCSRGIAQAAAEARAMIIDGGTDAGVMAMIGQGIADRGHRSTLLGVAPEGAVTYPGGKVEPGTEKTVPLDQNHSHFVLVEGKEWGCETDLMYALAEDLGQEVPVLTVLINGGLVSKDEVLRSVRRRWPVLVIEGTGRLADDLAGVWANKPPNVADTAVAEIIADGTLHFFPLDGTADRLEHKTLRLLNKDSPLRLAWERFAMYDQNAQRHQSSFRKIQLWILSLGIVATALALTQAELAKWKTFGKTDWLDSGFFRYSIVLMPIAISVLVAVASRLKQGNKWVLLRAGAEAIKREIFRYRARSKEYGNGKLLPEAVLADRVQTITRRVMHTDVNSSALIALKAVNSVIPRTGNDDGFSELTPERYIAVRLNDQLKYFESQTIKLEKKLKYLYWLIYGFGGVGTFLAAVGAQLWVAMTTTLVGAFTTYLGYQQIENTLTQYNQAATDLANINAWWSALSEEEKKDRGNYSILVENAEKVLESELGGWVQRMEDALAKLKEEQAKAAEQKRKAGRAQD